MADFTADGPYHWESLWDDAHRSPYGWSPYLVCKHGPAPSGSSLRLAIGFDSEAECDEFIAQVLAGGDTPT